MVTIQHFLEAELIVAQIIEAKEHPNADKLFVLKITTGTEEKQLVAGIRASYSADELVGKKIIVVNNLEHAVIRGETSQGMLLAATGEHGPVLLSPERDVPVGSRVK